MDLKGYEYVKTINEEQSFSKAAKRLFISQPSLSQYISRLEDQLKILLFDRSSNPVRLTYEGELYMESMHEISIILKDLNKKFEDISAMQLGKLNIGVTPSKANSALPRILPIFKEKFPKIDLILTEAASYELEDMLISGKVDLCLMNLPIKNPTIEYEPIASERILIAAPHDADLPSKPGKDYPVLSFEAISEQPFILLHPDQRLRQLSESLFDEHDIDPPIVLETRSIETSQLLANAGLGLCFVPESTLSYTTITNPPKYYTLEDELKWELVLAFKRGNYRSQAASAFIDTALSVLRDNK